MYLDLVNDEADIISVESPIVAITPVVDNPTVHDRRGYLGGSDAPAIIGVSKWKTPYQLWQEKTGEVDPDDLSGSERVYWGNVLEDVVAREYARRTGRKVRRINRALFHKDFAFIGAHIDRDVVGEDRILECKTADKFVGADWEDGCPDYYYPQIQHYLAVTGAAVCDVAVLIGGNTFKVFEVERDRDFISDLMVAEVAFWNMVESKTPPDPNTGAEAASRWPRVLEGDIFGSSEHEDIAEELDRTKGEIKALEALKEELEGKLKLAIGAGERLVYNGRPLATWKNESRQILDRARLDADHPGLAEGYMKTTESRVFRLSKGGKK